MLRFDVKWFLFVFPTFLSIIPMLYIVYIIDTDPSTYHASKKQLEEAHPDTYMPFDGHLTLVLSCSLHVDCIYWYC